VMRRLVEKHAWVNEFPVAITVCDKNGVILEMNAKSVSNFRKDGGRGLIGKNIFECHPEPALTKLRKLMRRRQRNVYTVEKRGKRKLIYQAPWLRAGRYGGFVELSIELPNRLPHLKRNS
jgi:hypothetical protein